VDDYNDIVRQSEEALESYDRLAEQGPSEREINWSDLCPACKGFAQEHRYDETCALDPETKGEEDA